MSHHGMIHKRYRSCILVLKKKPKANLRYRSLPGEIRQGTNEPLSASELLSAPELTTSAPNSIALDQHRHLKLLHLETSTSSCYRPQSVKSRKLRVAFSTISTTLSPSLLSHYFHHVLDIYLFVSMMILQGTL